MSELAGTTSSCSDCRSDPFAFALRALMHCGSQPSTALARMRCPLSLSVPARRMRVSKRSLKTGRAVLVVVRLSRSSEPRGRRVERRTDETPGSTSLQIKEKRRGRGAREQMMN